MTTGYPDHTDANSPAWPFLFEPKEFATYSYGMRKRELFAMYVMTAINQDSASQSQTPAQIAQRAVECADALIDALNGLNQAVPQ